MNIPLKAQNGYIPQCQYLNIYLKYENDNLKENLQGRSGMQFSV